MIGLEFPKRTCGIGLFCLIGTSFIYAHLRIVALISSVGVVTCELLPSDRNLKGDYFLEEQRPQTGDVKSMILLECSPGTTSWGKISEAAMLVGRQAERRGPYHRILLVECKTHFSTSIRDAVTQLRSTLTGMIQTPLQGCNSDRETYLLTVRVYRSFNLRDWDAAEICCSMLTTDNDPTDRALATVTQNE